MDDNWDYYCPQCRKGSHIEIEARNWVRLYADGTDEATALRFDGRVWDGECRAACGHCDWDGRVDDLLDERDDDLIEAWQETEHCQEDEPHDERQLLLI